MSDGGDKERLRPLIRLLLTMAMRQARQALWGDGRFQTMASVLAELVHRCDAGEAPGCPLIDVLSSGAAV